VHVLYFIIIIITIITITIIITIIIAALGGCENITKKGTVRTISLRCCIALSNTLMGSITFWVLLTSSLNTTGFYSLCKTGNPLRSLRIGGCRRIVDADLELLSHCSMQSTLSSIDLHRFEKLSDRGVAIVCKALGQRLTSLHLAGNRDLTDYSARIIGHFCPQLV
jgi:hypothetical protein